MNLSIHPDLIDLPTVPQIASAQTNEAPVLQRVEEVWFPIGGYTKTKALHDRLVMETIYYKGYEIRITPYQLAKSKQWALEFQILRPPGNNTLTKLFSAVNTYETEKEAEKNCLNLAMQIIDSRPTN